jgi:hypothetical protein
MLSISKIIEILENWSWCVKFLWIYGQPQHVLNSLAKSNQIKTISGQWERIAVSVTQQL